ncbi:MAG: NDP-sugar synthase, partial [Armatimonadota bacterium]
AFLLAAGLGTRLGALTKAKPKCLLPIGERSLLGHWLLLLAEHGYSEVLVNLHHLAEQVTDYLARQSLPLRVTKAYEPGLLGTAGTVRANRGFVADQSSFLIAYADNFTDADLTDLMNVHERNGAPLTMGLFHAPQPQQCGIAEVGADGRLLSFVEKPARPATATANAGIYAAGQALFDYLPETVPLDFGTDVLPRLVGRARGHLLSGQVIDIGTPEGYAAAQEAHAHGGLTNPTTH